jgi:hypothetical protein
VGTGADAMTAAGHEAMMRPVSNRAYSAVAGDAPSQVEADIAATRTELGEILGALERKLAPRVLLESGVDMLKAAISSKASQFDQSLRGQPLRLALVGLGIGWLLASQGVRPRRSQAAREADERADELVEEMRETVADAAAQAIEATNYAYAREKSDATVDNARLSLDRSGSAPNRTRGSAIGLTDQVPLALGVLGLLAGAAVALMLPRSAAEERLIGPAGEWLRKQAASLSREAVERVQHVAERTVDAAAEMVGNAINDAGQP